MIELLMKKMNKWGNSWPQYAAVLVKKTDRRGRDRNVELNRPDPRNHSQAGLQETVSTTKLYITEIRQLLLNAATEYATEDVRARVRRRNHAQAFLLVRIKKEHRCCLLANVQSAELRVGEVVRHSVNAFPTGLRDVVVNINIIVFYTFYT